MSNCGRFIKFIPSEESTWLRKNHPYAFLLLGLIAERARRTPGHIDGLEIGDAYLGDFSEAGIPTEAKYRTAKKTLVKIGAIKIKETNRNPLRNRENGADQTTRITTKGTLVTLLNSKIWDINSTLENDQNSEQPTKRQRLPRDEQERKKKETKKKEETFIPKNSLTF